MKDFIKSQITFEEELNNIIRERFNKEYPEYFIKATTLDEREYNSCIQGVQGWWIYIINSSLCTNSYKWRDSDYYRIGKDKVYAERERLLEDMYKADIRIWCLENMRP